LAKGAHFCHASRGDRGGVPVSRRLGAVPAARTSGRSHPAVARREYDEVMDRQQKWDAGKSVDDDDDDDVFDDDPPVGGGSSMGGGAVLGPLWIPPLAFLRPMADDLLCGLSQSRRGRRAWNTAAGVSLAPVISPHGESSGARR